MLQKSSGPLKHPGKPGVEMKKYNIKKGFQNSSHHQSNLPSASNAGRPPAVLTSFQKDDFQVYQPSVIDQNENLRVLNK